MMSTNKVTSSRVSSSEKHSPSSRIQSPSRLIYIHFNLRAHFKSFSETTTAKKNKRKGNRSGHGKRTQRYKSKKAPGFQASSGNTQSCSSSFHPSLNNRPNRTKERRERAWSITNEITSEVSRRKKKNKPAEIFLSVS